MSLWFRVQEYVVEVGLRLAKVLVATVFGFLVYLVLTGIFGMPASAQLAVESWIAGMLLFLIVETGIF